MPNEPIIDLSVLSAEPAEEYHAKATEFLSSHQLIDFMRCPYLHAKKRAGLIAEKESPAYLIGRAAHWNPSSPWAGRSTRRPASRMARAQRSSPSGVPTKANRSFPMSRSI